MTASCRPGLYGRISLYTWVHRARRRSLQVSPVAKFCWASTFASLCLLNDVEYLLPLFVSSESRLSRQCFSMWHLTKRWTNNADIKDIYTEFAGCSTRSLEKNSAVWTEVYYVWHRLDFWCSYVITNTCASIPCLCMNPLKLDLPLFFTEQNFKPKWTYLLQN